VPVKTFLAEHQTRAAEFYPIVRARLTQINGHSTDGNKDEALNRELNLTWSEQRPDHNPLVAGSWPPKPGEVSIEEGWRSGWGEDRRYGDLYRRYSGLQREGQQRAQS
jgi:putative ABC transport system permease protein